ESRQRARGLRASRTTTYRRHRGHARVRMALQLHLDALGAEGAQEPGAPGRGQEPREVQDADLVQREWFAVRRQLLADRRALEAIDHRQIAITREDHSLRVLVQERRAPAH